jgi:hypothetical protein
LVKKGYVHSKGIAKIQADGSRVSTFVILLGGISSLTYLFSYAHVIIFFIFTQQRFVRIYVAYKNNGNYKFETCFPEQFMIHNIYKKE